MTDSDGARDLDREETADDTGSSTPSRSRVFRLFAWLVDNGIIIVSVAGLSLVLGLQMLGYDLPRWFLVVAITCGIASPLFGLPVAKRVRSMLWEPSWIWIVDLAADEPGHGGIYRWPSQQFRDVTVTDGELDWITPGLAFGKHVDLEAGTVQGSWRGTLSDRELMRALSAVKECRGQLERDAKRGFRIESQAFTIVRSAVRSGVMSVVSTFERNSLPDEGEGINAAIDDAIEDFGFDRAIRENEEDRSPESQADPVVADLDDDLADLAGGAADRAAADGGVDQ